MSSNKKVEMEELIRKKMEELRKVSHADVSDAKLRCAAKLAIRHSEK